MGARAASPLRPIPLASHRPRRPTRRPPRLRPLPPSKIRHCSLFIAHCSLLIVHSPRLPLHLSSPWLLSQRPTSYHQRRLCLRASLQTGGRGPGGFLLPHLGRAPARRIAAGGTIRRRRPSRPLRRDHPAHGSLRRRGRIRPQPGPSRRRDPGSLSRSLPGLLLSRLARHHRRRTRPHRSHRARRPHLFRRPSRPPHHRHPLRRNFPASRRRRHFLFLPSHFCHYCRPQSKVQSPTLLVSPSPCLPVPLSPCLLIPSHCRVQTRHR